MARPFPSNIVRKPGKIKIEKTSPSLFQVFFTPPQEAMSSKRQNPEDFTKLILFIDLEKQTLTFIPLRVWSVNSMQNRHYKLQTITVEINVDKDWEPVEDEIADILEMELPTVFISDYNYGLGFRKEYRHIVNMLEQMGAEHLYITNAGMTGFNKEKKQAIFKQGDLYMIKRRLDSVTDKARSVANDIKSKVVIELFSGLIRGDATIDGNASVRKEIADLMGSNDRFMTGRANKKEQKEAIEVITKNSEKILRDQPEQLTKLRNNIETVTLKELIKKFEGMLEKDLPESAWQKMFAANPFIINMTFGTPLVKIQDQAYIGGRKLDGSGEKIADFLCKNGSTNNATIVEIKTPGSKLISSRPYRGNLFSPSTELSSAINQVLDQIYLFEKNIAGIKEAARITDLETYSVAGVLIIGRSLLELDQIKSFELYRGNSKNIQVITFDELLSKLKLLLEFLSPDDSDDDASSFSGNDEGSDEDLPF